MRSFFSFFVVLAISWMIFFFIALKFNPEKAIFSASLTVFMMSISIFISKSVNAADFFSKLNLMRLILCILLLNISEIKFDGSWHNYVWSILPTIGLSFIAESLASRMKWDKKLFIIDNKEDKKTDS